MTCYTLEFSFPFNQSCFVLCKQTNEKNKRNSRNTILNIEISIAYIVISTRYGGIIFQYWFSRHEILSPDVISAMFIYTIHLYIIYLRAHVWFHTNVCRYVYLFIRVQNIIYKLSTFKN